MTKVAQLALQSSQKEAKESMQSAVLNEQAFSSDFWLAAQKVEIGNEKHSYPEHSPTSEQLYCTWR